MAVHSKASVKQTLLFLLPITQLVILWVVCGSVDFDLSLGVWLVALVAIGMVHGAMDISIIRRQSKSSERRRGTWRRVSGYMALMVLALVGLMLIPRFTVLGFLILTAVHFGEADRTYFNQFFTDSPDFPRCWAWIRGALVIVIPCYFVPAEAWMPFAALTGVSGGESMELLLQRFSLLLAGVACLLAVVSVLRSYRQLLSYSFLFFVLESVVASVWFFTMPPLLAIGGYFLCIHATRHMIRLMQDDYLRDKKSILVAQLRMHKDAMVFWLPAVLVVIFWACLLDTESVMRSVAYASIGFYLISTLPHHLLVCGMDGTRDGDQTG